MTTKSETTNAAAGTGHGAPDLSRREAIKRTAGLLGLALSARWIEGIAAAQVAAAAGGGPKHLKPDQFAIVSAAAERILPKSNTPGALDVGVPAFIDVMYGGYLTAAEQETLAKGLSDLEARSRRAHSKAFAQTSATQQDAILKAVATESQTKEKTFFHLLRELTVTGYFTSEQVGRNVTHFDPIPGRFEACVPLSEVGNRSWTR